MTKIKDNSAVSAIIGTILLLIVAVSAMSLVYLNVLNDDGPLNQRFVTVVGTVEGTNMVIEHRGGENLPIKDISLSIIFLNETLEINLDNNLSESAKADGYWSLGERISIPFPIEKFTDYENIEADIVAVDNQFNNIAFIGNLDLNVVSDVSIQMVSSNPNPYIDDEVIYIISVTNPEGIIDAKNVSFRIELPDSFSIDGYTADQGSFDSDTGIWTIGDMVLSHSYIELQISTTYEGSDESFEFTQLCILVDGSGSVRDADWNIMRTGLSAAILDPSVFPHDGSVELTIIQFAQNGAYLEIGPTVITNSNFVSVANNVQTLNQRDGGTPLSCGLKLAADTLFNSPQFDAGNRQVINIVTDGMPNRNCRDDEGVYTGSNVNYEQGKESAVKWRDYLINQCSLTEEQDEIDSLAVGSLSGYYTSGPDSEWLNSSIIWPIPGCIAPPFDKGRSWVREVDEWEEFYNATKEMFRIIFEGIWITGEVHASSPRDPNEINDRTQVLIVPSN